VVTEQAATPTITEVSNTDTEIVFTITNNDASTAVILWEVDDSSPDANSLELATGVTSSNITVDSLADDTTFIVYATANVTGKIKSEVASESITTDETAFWYGDRALFAGGFLTAVAVNTIDYVAIPTAANAADFGDLTQDRSGLVGCSDGSRGLFAGGSSSNTIDFVTVATTGNATDFGDLTTGRTTPAGCSNGIRGVFGGGAISGSDLNSIDFVTIATAGNATDFGDLTQARKELDACSSETRGLFGGG
jgi:hypothetical protein